jgi:hypothetical protein
MKVPVVELGEGSPVQGRLYRARKADIAEGKRSILWLGCLVAAAAFVVIGEWGELTAADLLFAAVFAGFALYLIFRHLRGLRVLTGLHLIIDDQAGEFRVFWDPRRPWDLMPLASIRHLECHGHGVLYLSLDAWNERRGSFRYRLPVLVEALEHAKAFLDHLRESTDASVSASYGDLVNPKTMVQRAMRQVPLVVGGVVAVAGLFRFRLPPAATYALLAVAVGYIIWCLVPPRG